MAKQRYKGRRQEVYLPSANELERWKTAASKHHVSLSKLICEAMEAYLNTLEPVEISEDLVNLQAQLNRLKDELKDKSLRLEKAETDLFNLNYQAFLDPDPESAKFSTELIDLLRDGGAWPGLSILKSLHIDPANSDSIRIVSNQLNILQSFGLIKETAKGWRWF
ncbi:MAG: hypothetical protein O8C67_15725 [Candidatus Methanoperedens sp.]|nr:hypothetical protein [Candidatus Methanoperedens sp.]